MDEQMMKAMKKQTYWARLTALCMAGIFVVALVSAIILVPRTTNMLENATQTIEEADVAVQELSKTASQLAKIDIEGLVDDTQALINESSEGISKALEKMDQMDIESLNKAISDLGSVIAPLAKLFGR